MPSDHGSNHSAWLLSRCRIGLPIFAKNAIACSATAVFSEAKGANKNGHEPDILAMLPACSAMRLSTK
eukprot:15442859-Alexandrium_andersonii.AAC.1